jgi:hypothetical protein
VRQVYQIHDAENQGQPRSEQKQEHAKLYAVEALLDEVQHGFLFPRSAPD